MTNQETLNMLRMMHGKDVICTNGLFHIIDNNHNEIYINKHNGEIDRRGKYNTIIVYDDVVLAEVVNDVKVRYVILSKNNLECIYRSTEAILYINEDLMYDTVGILISKHGKVLGKFNNIKDIVNIANKYYLLSSNNMFSDKVISYIEHKDFIQDLTKNKNYTISIVKENKHAVDVIDMNGGKHRYDFSDHSCINLFTMKKEDIGIWTIT